MITVWLSFSSLLTCVFAFYLPGLAPKTYCDKDNADGTCKKDIPLFVNRLDSSQSILPFDYRRFPFCEADKDSAILPASENLGQVLFGERISSSPIKFDFNQTVSCQKICKKTLKKDLKDDEKKQYLLLRRAIRLEYRHHWIVDNLPVLWCHVDQDGSDHCERGFPIGCYVDQDGRPSPDCLPTLKSLEPSAFYLFNHFNFTIIYHEAEKGTEWASSFENENAGRIVSVHVKLASVKQKVNGDDPACTLDGSPVFFRGEKKRETAAKDDNEDEQDIYYSYEVHWQKNQTIKWSSRWDYVLSSIQHTEIQWFGIANSMIIVLFMSGMIALIMLRTLRRDIARYNEENSEEAQEEFGWKLVHGDVFRPPSKGMLFSVFLGNGVQILFMTAITLLFACLGFLSPASRGFLMTCAVVCYVLMGTPSGYVSARVYKMFGGERWKSNVLLTALLVPGLIFGMFFLLNMVLWAEGSSAAVPFGTLVAVLALWFCVSTPLTFIGAYFGFKRSVIENPVRTNQIPRQIPPQSCYTRPLPGILMGAVLPFGSIFIQLHFIFNSIWAHQVYYMFGLVFLVFLLLVITCSETAILLCYFHLCSEDYNWWWRSFLTTGCTAVYLFIYSIHYYVTEMVAIDAASTFLYFGYTLMMVVLFFLLTGCIGFFACYWFVRVIYSVVKVD